MRRALRRRISGEIRYRGPEGVDIGRETFEIAEHAGGRTMRALCEMDDIGLLRDVTLALDPQWRPLDAFCRITKDGARAATTWIAVGAEAVELEGDIAGLGRISQRFPNAPPYAYVGLHPVQGDALVTVFADETRPGEFAAVRGLANSTAMNGDEGLCLTPIAVEVAFIARETVEVAAGRFPARRYALRWSPDWPDVDIWVRDTDPVFLKLTWSAIESWYELAWLREDGPSAPPAAAPER